MEDMRKKWQDTKKFLETSNPGNPKVKQLLKSFDQGLGPAIDRFIKAGQTGNVADAKKYMAQIWKILKDYETKVKAVPLDAWADTPAGQSLARTKALGSLGGLQLVLQEAKRKFPNDLGSVVLG
jgi:soluble cytochrome b562